MRLQAPTNNQPRQTFWVSDTEFIFVAHIVSINKNEDESGCVEVWCVGKSAPYLLDKEKTQELCRAFPEFFACRPPLPNEKNRGEIK